MSFAYNAANLLTATTLPDQIEERYGYDEANEVTLISYQKGSEKLGELNYSYDPNGRREAVWGSYARTGLPEAISSAAYNAANEQTERNGTKLTYDADGNLTSDGNSEYKWNARNQLTEITGAMSTSFGYDPFGHRISKTLAGTTTKILYDGPNAVQETEGNSTANLLTGLLPDTTFARTTSTATESLLTDALGSTIALAGASGKVETSYTYDPFGSTTQEGTASNPFQYVGRENDGDDLYYNRARYYSPTAARFISQDPLGEAGGGSNLYLYVGNDPLDLTDPYGTHPHEPWGPGTGKEPFPPSKGEEKEREDKEVKEQEKKEEEKGEYCACGGSGKGSGEVPGPSGPEPTGPITVNPVDPGGNGPTPAPGWDPGTTQPEPGVGPGSIYVPDPGFA